MRTGGISSLLAAAMSLWGLWGSIVVHGQEPTPPGTLDLARIVYGEVQRPGPDTAAIYAVLEDRARVRGDRSWRHAARAYAGGHLDRRRTDRRRWVAHLRADGLRPRGWPLGASWGRSRRRWLDTYVQAARVLSGRETASCAPHHWGSLDPRLPDVHRARRAKWVRADCGDTILGYWHVPARLRKGDAS